MAGTLLGFPFDEDIFNYNWNNAKDPVKTAILESGAMVEDPLIAGMIQNGSDSYTVPFYGLLSGNEANYDGKTDIPVGTVSGFAETGVVYGRAMGWSEDQFVRDFNSGADPMASIVSQVAAYWNHKRQNRLITIANAVLSLDAMKPHVIDKSTEAIAETTIGDASVDAFGDNASAVSLAVMHSKVANKLAGLKVLNYLKYTDAAGIERQMNIAQINGLTVVVDDAAPVTPGESSKPNKYTTLLFGQGAIRYARANVEVPAEVSRDPKKAGGQNTLWTRVRETIHPDGFSFVKPKSGYTGSPTDAQLAAKANWALVADPKVTPIASVITLA
ncbi:hypothetical protein K6V98_08310 [Collinsella sp. AGMB00827]|uniref:Coat protein n=1 Tax=Collinsella ureilytica TaxID=2869515 RepID=A0ABS7MM41_9ACTN|nr:major capsid protein [Collinsella urealyticum]MBY4798347.1 hypothetical protein [Collinsella urealyticum]